MSAYEVQSLQYLTEFRDFGVQLTNITEGLNVLDARLNLLTTLVFIFLVAWLSFKFFSFIGGLLDLFLG